MPAIEPSIMKWAREMAGLSLEEAARAISLKDASGKSGAERLALLEAGKQEPSRALLERMAQKYRRPLLVFYLSEPPRKGDRGEDFRSLPGETSEAQMASVDALIRDLKARQSLVKSLLEDEEAQPLSFINSARMEQGYEAVAADIVDTLNFELAEFRARKTIDEAIAYLRGRIEEAGIFVLLIGDLGNYHTAFSVADFRGFAFADPIAPFVVVNSQDAKSARAFTMLHEVAHLWLGKTGISGDSFEREIERFCNNVAGTILLPDEELRDLAAIQSLALDDAVAKITAFAASRNISRAMVAYKLFVRDKIGQELWQALDAKFKERKGKKRESSGGGPNYYIVRRHHLGTALLDLARRSIHEGTLTPTKAAKILGVAPRNVEPLLRGA